MTSFTKSFKSSKVDYKTVFGEQETLLHINCTSVSNCFTGDCPTTELYGGIPPWWAGSKVTMGSQEGKEASSNYCCFITKRFVFFLNINLSGLISDMDTKPSHGCEGGGLTPVPCRSPYSDYQCCLSQVTCS